MAKYAIKRIFLGLLTLFIVATLTFFLMNAVPGGPFVAEKSISPAAQAALEAKYNLDKPILERYGIYMSDLLHGDMGPSLKQRGRDVSTIISTKFPVSARLALWAVAVAVCVGIPIGVPGRVSPGQMGG